MASSIKKYKTRATESSTRVEFKLLKVVMSKTEKRVMGFLFSFLWIGLCCERSNGTECYMKRSGRSSCWPVGEGGEVRGTRGNLMRGREMSAQGGSGEGCPTAGWHRRRHGMAPAAGKARNPSEAARDVSLSLSLLQDSEIVETSLFGLGGYNII
jgi:hypothetical protein